MNKQSITAAVLLCLFLLTLLLLQQLLFVLSTLNPDDPRIGVFAERYRVTSSAEVIATVALGATLSASVLFHQTPLRVAALAIFCALRLWRGYISGVVPLFAPPLGDGSISHAATLWWQLHSEYALIHIPSIVLLSTLSLFLGYQAYVLRQRTASLPR